MNAWKVIYAVGDLLGVFSAYRWGYRNGRHDLAAAIVKVKADQLRR